MILKLVILLSITAVCLAQESNETSSNNEDENLTALDLSNKGLTTLKEYDFSKYQLLEELDLSNNDIDYIKEDTFIKNTKLRKINLSGNTKLILPQYSTLLNANIQELNLSNCNIETLPPNILDGVIDLKILDLSDNPLEDQGISLITLTNLRSPEKIIIPFVDEPMMKELCDELDIIIDIKSEDYAESVPCEHIRDGTWSFTAEEGENQQDTGAEQTEDTETTVYTQENTEPPAPFVEDQNTEETETEPSITETPAVLETTTEIQDNLKSELEDEATQVNLNIPDAIYGLSNEDKPSEDKQPSVHEENHENDAPFMQRGVLLPQNKPNDQNKENMQQNVPEKMQKHNEDNNEERAKEGESTEASSGSNILIFLVIAVVIAGAAAFGYKFYKTRTYRTTNTEEPVGRELKEIVVDRRMNGPDKPAPIDEAVEQQIPLMDKHENNTEIKEIDENRVSQNSTHNRNFSSPYVPTTTTHPPENEIKDHEKTEE